MPDGGGCLIARGVGHGRLWIAFVLCAALAPACRNLLNPCKTVDCSCSAGEECDLPCDEPPCNLRCERESRCSGGCANGTCVCEDSARCDFECNASPGNVRCVNNTTCSGTCADGTCDCGPDSDCHFRCAGGPCHTLCAPGASCIVECPEGTAGTQDCDIPKCAAGKAAVCPGGKIIVCNARCPTRTDRDGDGLPDAKDSSDKGLFSGCSVIGGAPGVVLRKR
jgi:hypothetical protein